MSLKITAHFTKKNHGVITKLQNPAEKNYVVITKLQNPTDKRKTMLD